MTIKQQGGIFGRNPTFNDVTVDDTLTAATRVNTPILVNGVASGTLTIGAGAAQNTGANIIMYGESHPQVSDFLFRAGTTGLVRIQDSGEVKILNGNLRFDTAGTGIDFSATSGTGTSELFDDYEEGTWTVELYDAASAGNVSPTTATGYYTKIGRQVNITLSLSNIDTTGMTAGNVLYFTLPFTAGFVSTGSLVLDSFAMTAGRTWAAPWVNAADTRGRFRQSGNAVTAANLTVATVVSGTSDIERCTLTYFVG